MGIDFRRSFHFVNEKRFFSDRAPSTARIPLQMQNLDAFEVMTAVTLQFLQHTAQSQAGVTVSPKGPDDMEIDALTKKGKIHKGKKGRAKLIDRNEVDSYAAVLDTWQNIVEYDQRWLVQRHEQEQAKERTVSTRLRPRQSRQ